MNVHEKVQRVVNDLADQHDLTPKERELLPFFVTGLGHDEIAAVNFISNKTIKNHAANLYRKLQVKNRQHLMVKVLDLILQQQERGNENGIRSVDRKDQD